jgi:SAM-dependent methyltransferase
VSVLSAALFSWVQGAGFYEGTCRAAVELLPPGAGRTWLDVGCGPGLVTRLASRRGYDALGVDRDVAMVCAARRFRHGSERYEVSDLEGVAALYQAARADVVSAASLLYVLRDPESAVVLLWSCVRPGGRLLVVETTRDMTPERVDRVLGRVARGRRLGLRLWARARRGRAVDRSVLDAARGATIERHLLLEGLVEACLLTKPAA